MFNLKYLMKTLYESYIPAGNPNATDATGRLDLASARAFLASGTLDE